MKRKYAGMSDITLAGGVMLAKTAEGSFESAVSADWPIVTS
jgi:hypothetical protein